MSQCPADIDTQPRPVLNPALKTVALRILHISFHKEGSWGDEEDTVLQIAGQAGLFHHTERNRWLRRAAPTPNPLARQG